MKHTTPEQRAQAEARRERFRAIVRKVAAMTDEQRAELAGQVMPTTVEGHTLSLHNACLLACQCPTVTLVGGFRQWLKAGRVVRKGEHGLMLWIPSARAKPETDTDDTPDRRPGFLMGTVFDVSQTEELTEPVAVVSPAVAEAFGLAALPNVREVAA